MMSESNAKKLALKCLALVLLVSGLILFSKDSTKLSLASSQQLRENGQLPAITIATQDEVPLRIVDTSVESSDPENIRLRLTVQNQSTKKIRSYAIVADSIVAGKQSGRVEFVNLTKPSAILQPTQTVMVGIAYNKSEQLESAKLAIDFVEFDDGSAWGPDVNKSRDRLSGQRAGAKMERRRLRELLKAKGAAATLASISGETYGDDVPGSTSEHSAEWQEGFRSGVGSIRHRIKQALQTGDSTQLEKEVARPFDTSEGEPQ